jgi:hypothetical protein
LSVALASAEYGSQYERKKIISTIFYNELKNSCKKKLYIEVCTQEARRGIGWWKMGIWRLKSIRGNTEQGMCPMCNKRRRLEPHTEMCGNQKLEGGACRQTIHKY